MLLKLGDACCKEEPTSVGNPTALIIVDRAHLRVKSFVYTFILKNYLVKGFQGLDF